MSQEEGSQPEPSVERQRAPHTHRQVLNKAWMADKSPVQQGVNGRVWWRPLKADRP